MSNLLALAALWLGDGTLFLFLCGIAYFARHLGGQKLWLLALLGSFLLMFFAVSNPVFFPLVPDYHGYCVPAYLLLGVGAARLLDQGAFAKLGSAGQFVILPVLSLLFLVHGFDLSEQKLPTILASDMLKEVPQNATIVVDADHLLFPTLFLQSQGLRPDVMILNPGFAASTWYIKYLKRTHRQLMVQDLLLPSTRHERLAQILAQRDADSIFFESPILAARLGLRVCSDRPLPKVGAGCKLGADAHAIERLSDYWALSKNPTPWSQAVIARFSEMAALPPLQSGRFEAGLEILRHGIPQLMRPPVCTAVTPAVALVPPQLPPTLMGSPQRNLAHFRALCKQLQ